MEVSYASARLTLAVGAQNLFNVFPDRNTTVNSFNGIQTFPSHSPFGMNGRTITGGWCSNVSRSRRKRAHRSSTESASR